MGSLSIKSSITEAALKRFINNANEGDALSCTAIKGFSVVKNRAKGSASFRYRPSLRGASRNPAIIGKANVLKLAEATQIALKMMEVINEGGEAKDALKGPRVAPTARLQAISKDDPAILGNFIDQVYMPFKLRQNPDTAYDNFNTLKREFGHLFKKPMSKLTGKDIKDWQNKKEKQGLVFKTIERYYAILIALINMAVKISHDSSGEYAGLLYDSPFPVKPLQGASKAQRDAILKQEREIGIHVRRMLTDEELIKIEQAMYRFGEDCIQQRARSRQHSNRLHLPCLKDVAFPHWIIPYIYVAYYTGLRPGDVAGLEWEDIHAGKITRTTNKSKHLVKPSVVILPIKDNASVFKYSLKEVLALWQEQNDNPKRGWVFPQTQDNSKPLSAKGYKKSWAKITEYAGLNLHMYSFRHHFISNLIRAGVNMMQIAGISGHKSIAMIEAHYAHHFPSDIEDALSIF